MKFNDSLARICIRILYVWQLWILIDCVVHLVFCNQIDLTRMDGFRFICMMHARAQVDCSWAWRSVSLRFVTSSKKRNDIVVHKILKTNLKSCPVLTLNIQNTEEKSTDKTCCKVVTLWWRMHFCRVVVVVVVVRPSWYRPGRLSCWGPAGGECD